MYFLNTLSKEAKLVQIVTLNFKIYLIPIILKKTSSEKVDKSYKKIQLTFLKNILSGCFGPPKNEDKNSIPFYYYVFSSHYYLWKSYIVQQ